MRHRLAFFAPAAALLALPGTAFASFHLMQIEQVTGGVLGDQTQQAIQLRMRSAFQNNVQFARVVVVDAAGANPVIVVDMGNMVTHNAQGDRVLIATAAFAQQQNATPDFTATNPIPASYLAGGKLMFTDDGMIPTIYWSVCWGTYTGSTTGSATNDADGTFGPCEPGALPSADLTALKFQNNETALSTNNAADYALTPGPATFTNNAGTPFILTEPPLFADGFE